MSEWISARELSKRLGWHPASLRRLARAIGLPQHMEKLPNQGRGSKMVIFSESEVALLEQESKQRSRPSQNPKLGPRQETGHLYLVQVDPERRPERIKVGFTTDVDMRLRKFQTVCPTAVLVDCWPCKGLWEQTARDFITRTCKLVEGSQREVFDGDYQEVRKLGNEFFKLSPLEVTKAE